MSTAKAAISKAFRLPGRVRQSRNPRFLAPLFIRSFNSSARLEVVKPFLLADIGEGITECQLIQWFVQPGARVEQFDKICEVQSDKASVEITSPFDGVIKKLHYEPDDMAITGKPLVDIDIEGEISEADAQQLGGGVEGEEAGAGGEESAGKETSTHEAGADEEATQKEQHQTSDTTTATSSPPSKGSHGTLATPAVRRMTKEHGVNIADILGTGKDGRVLKEDVSKHISSQGQQQQQSQQQSTAPAPAATSSREDRKVSLSPVQSQMFKTMTRSLNIPHFLYSTTADMGAISNMRQRLNRKAQSAEQKVTHLPFILKALSLALQRHPLLNSSLNTADPKKPELTYKGAHNFGVAIDAPSGLLVPVLKNVQDLSVSEIASSLRQLSDKARNNKLAPGDFSGATFTVSNIGSVGGGVVAPVISEPQVAILGIGRSKMVPAFDENDELIKKEELVLSWSADHRVVDGAECARCAERVKSYLEDPGSLLLDLR
jgi:2-oxoisovalerate dehydrogenase E2 component (dihydrolipoyl transacylase)